MTLLDILDPTLSKENLQAACIGRVMNRSTPARGARGDSHSLMDAILDYLNVYLEAWMYLEPHKKERKD